MISGVVRTLIATYAVALVLTVGCSRDSGSSGAGSFSRFEFGDQKTFSIPGGLAVPSDFQRVETTITFDPSVALGSAQARVRLRVLESGFPYLFLDPRTTVTRDGRAIAVERHKDPDGQNTMLVLKERMEAGEEAEFLFRYRVDSSEVSYRANGVGFISSMSDLDTGHYFERYGPANYEADVFSMRLTLEVLGGSVAPHRVFTNGKRVSETATSWEIEFPVHFNSSSFFVHLTDRTDLIVRSFSVTGLEREIPVVVYGASADLVDPAVARLPSLFVELERDYGPYVHDSFVAYMNSSSGGMEYVGSTVTSIGALGHELTHSWFARGVMPADGRAGWIDEGIASWRDNGYFRATALGARSAANLANLSPFERFTPRNCYRDGRLFFSELDLRLAGQGGAKAFLKRFFAERQKRTVTTDDFQAFLEGTSRTDLAAMFATYIYGDYLVAAAARPAAVDGESLHPTPLTAAEVQSLR